MQMEQLQLITEDLSESRGGVTLTEKLFLPQWHEPV
jgi:hypothetical protein